MLRQNRRVVKGEDADTAERKEELEVFHKILSDVSMGIASERTRTFLTQAYVRGALHCATADHAELEGNTSVFRASPTHHYTYDSDRGSDTGERTLHAPGVHQEAPGP